MKQALPIIAVGVAAISLIVSLVNYDRDPKGLCVAYNVNTVGTLVEAPKFVNGVLTCEVGTFTSIQPN